MTRTQDLPDGTYRGRRVKIVTRGARLTRIRALGTTAEVWVPSRDVAQGTDR